METFDGTLLVADSGSTKTDWRIIGGKAAERAVATQGLNPAHQEDCAIEESLRGELLPWLQGETVGRVCFYGAGCRGEDAGRMRTILAESLGVALESVSVWGDLLGAARSVCGRDAGIACILGTGSNSCVFDGKSITANVPPLGYILGDEGSGAVLGKLFLNAVFKDESLKGLRDEFLDWAGISYDEMIRRVYRAPMANRFLASLSPFIGKRLEMSSVREIVKDNFRQFFRNNVARYNRRDLPVCAVGSIAFHYRELLAETAAEEGFAVGKIIKSPIEGLAEYHR